MYLGIKRTRGFKNAGRGLTAPRPATPECDITLRGSWRYAAVTSRLVRVGERNSLAAYYHTCRLTNNTLVTTCQLTLITLFAAASESGLIDKFLEKTLQSGDKRRCKDSNLDRQCACVRVGLISRYGKISKTIVSNYITFNINQTWQVK